jgi:hypothetical protein
MSTRDDLALCGGVVQVCPMTLDDFHDACEAVHFLAITIATALYWFFFHHLPSRRCPRIQLEVDVRDVGPRGASRLIEVAASVANAGHVGIELTDLRFAVDAVAPDGAPPESGPLLGPPALRTLFTGHWPTGRGAGDPGTRVRHACAATIPGTVTHVLVTGQARLTSSGDTYSASRVVPITA